MKLKHLLLASLALSVLFTACKSDTDTIEEQGNGSSGSSLVNVEVNNAKYGEVTTTVTANGTVELYANPTAAGYFYNWTYTVNGRQVKSIDNPLTLTNVKAPMTVSAKFITINNVLFSDDFKQESTVPDPSKWVLCARGSSDWNNTCSGSYDQAYVKDGKLILEGIYDEGEYKTGAVQWAPSIGFQYVRVEVVARLATSGQGQWPAIWMMPRKALYSGWPACGEIDIMEHLNTDTYYYTTLHSAWIDTAGNRNSPQYSQTVEFNQNDWNTYVVEWNDDALTFFLNGKKTFSYPNFHLDNEDTARQWPFATTFYLILSQQLGGSWVGDINNLFLPATMEIDRVLVTKL